MTETKSRHSSKNIEEVFQKWSNLKEGRIGRMSHPGNVAFHLPHQIFNPERHIIMTLADFIFVCATRLCRWPVCTTLLFFLFLLTHGVMIPFLNVTHLHAYLENTTPAVSPFLEYHIGSKLTIKITHRVSLYSQIELLINAIWSFA